MKIITFKVRQVEKPIFQKINEKYGFDLEIHEESLTIENIHLTKGFDCVIVRVDGTIDKEMLDKLKANGVKYLLTRTVGKDHIDCEYGNKIGLKMARVASYSPTAIAEAAFSSALMLSRKTLHFANKSSKKDFTIDPTGFAFEIRNKTVGIIGTGKIGLATAKMFKGVTDNILGFDIYKSEEAKKILTYVDSLEELVSKCDILSFHCPYIKGQNDKMINEELIKKMKDNVILVNYARGQIQDEKAIIAGIESGKIQGVALDVLNNEKELFFKKHETILNESFKKLIDLYPKVIITPHIGSYTDMAVENMIEFSYENLIEFEKTGTCKNKI